MAVAVICGTAGAAAPAKVHVGLSASFALSGGGALWVTDRVGNKLIRVDPAAGRVKWRLGIPSSPFGLTYGAGSVWVGSRNTTRVTRVNPTTKKVRARISVGAAPYALAFGAGSVWVSNESSGTVSRIAPKRNRVVKTIRVGGGPNGIAVAFKKEQYVVLFVYSVQFRIAVPAVDDRAPLAGFAGSRRTDEETRHLFDRLLRG